MNNYFESHCGQPHHYFLRDEDDQIHVFHADDSPCESAEFSLDTEDMDRILRCAWCDKKPVTQDHIRKCSGYKPAHTEGEIRDSLSHPTEHMKRDILLTNI